MTIAKQCEVIDTQMTGLLQCLYGHMHQEITQINQQYASGIGQHLNAPLEEGPAAVEDPTLDLIHFFLLFGH